MKGPEEGAAGGRAMPMNEKPADILNPNRWTILDDFEFLYHEARRIAAAVLKKGGKTDDR